MNPSSDYRKRLSAVERFQRKLSKIRVGLPSKVVFTYDKGKVTAYPKQKKWIVEANNKKQTHFVREGQRNDITKYKARFFLKLVLCGLWKGDKK